MNRLSALLRSRIERLGPMPFREFMAAALYHPEHGYYASGRARIGRRGDFLTNVSVGPLFGRLLARQFVEMWERLGAPAGWTIVEQGAHRGEFARDALDGLQEFAPACFAAMRYAIVEPIEALWGPQIRALDGLPVKWFRKIEDLDPLVGIHFSNELLDAFPIHLVARREHGWIERHVAWQEDRFVFTDGPLTDPRLAVHLSSIDAPIGFVTEVNLGAQDWLNALAAKLERGYILVIDYGYLREQFFERQAGTLSAYAAHRREPDPLAHPGEIDLTAHVEFSSLIEHAERLGFRLHGLTDQHRFMAGLSRLHFSDETVLPNELRAFKTLMHPELMGQVFKVLCLEKGVDSVAPLSGFEFGR